MATQNKMTTSTTEATTTLTINQSTSCAIMPTIIAQTATQIHNNSATQVATTAVNTHSYITINQYHLYIYIKTYSCTYTVVPTLLAVSETIRSYLESNYAQ